MHIESFVRCPTNDNFTFSTTVVGFEVQESPPLQTLRAGFSAMGTMPILQVTVFEIATTTYAKSVPLVCGHSSQTLFISAACAVPTSRMIYKMKQMCLRRGKASILENSSLIQRWESISFRGISTQRHCSVANEHPNSTQFVWNYCLGHCVKRDVGVHVLSECAVTTSVLLNTHGNAPLRDGHAQETIGFGSKLSGCS